MHRNMYYVQDSMTNLSELRSRAIFLTSGPNSDTVTLHMHSSADKSCEGKIHEEYSPKGVK